MPPKKACNPLFLLPIIRDSVMANADKPTPKIIIIAPIMYMYIILLKVLIFYLTFYTAKIEIIIKMAKCIYIFFIAYIISNVKVHL